MNKSIVLMLAIFALGGCTVETGPEECQLDCTTERVVVSTETVCELREVEVTGTTCVTAERFTSNTVCATKTDCDTGEYSYVDTNCSTANVTQGGTVCGEGAYSYRDTECVTNDVSYGGTVYGTQEFEYTQDVCLVDEWESTFEPVDTDVCPESILGQDGNYYDYCVEFADGFSECGMATRGDVVIHGMTMHLSCSAVYNEDGYPDQGAPIEGVDPAVVNLSVAKWRVHDGCCELKNECESSSENTCNTFECTGEDVSTDLDVSLEWEQTCEETSCTTGEVSGSVEVCSDWESTHEETTCTDTTVTSSVEVCIEEDFCWPELTRIQEEVCEEVTLTQELEVCWEVETFENVTTCDESSCDPDEEWVQGGGRLGSE